MRTADHVRPVYPTWATGYESWCKETLRPDVACLVFEGYAETLAMIAQKREAMRQLDIKGPMGKTWGWSPGKNFKLSLEMPLVAALCLKAALGRDCLQDPKKRQFIAQQHPEFVLGGTR